MGHALLRILVVFAVLFGGMQGFADGQIPWPWGTEAPFPWRKVDGTWVGKYSSNGHELFFSFKSVTWPNGQRILRIKEFDPKSGRVYARGVGFENRRIVSAFMSDRCGYRYRISVRAYRDRSFKGRMVRHIALSMGPANSFGKWDDHFVLKRVGRRPHRGKKYKSCP